MNGGFEDELTPTVPRRRHVRIPCAHVSAWLTGAVRTPATVVNVSRSGAMIKPFRQISLGAFVGIDLLMGRVMLATLRAKVVHVSESGVGLEFVGDGLSPSVLHRLR